MVPNLSSIVHGPRLLGLYRLGSSWAVSKSPKLRLLGVDSIHIIIHGSTDDTDRSTQGPPAIAAGNIRFIRQSILTSRKERSFYFSNGVKVQVSSLSTQSRLKLEYNHGLFSSSSYDSKSFRGSEQLQLDERQEYPIRSAAYSIAAFTVHLKVQQGCPVTGSDLTIGP
jgi:hypothetical protein